MTSDRILPGDIYEDTDYHPVLCTEADEDDVSGISLIDGSAPRSCSLSHCDVQRLSVVEALELRGIWDTILSIGDRKALDQNKFEIITKTRDEVVFFELLSALNLAPNGVRYNESWLLQRFIEMREQGIFEFNDSRTMIPTQTVLSYCLLVAQRHGLVKIEDGMCYLTEEGVKALLELSK